MLWLLLTVLPAFAAGQNVSSTKPPVYNATTTRQDTVSTGFRAPSTFLQPSTVFRATARLDAEVTSAARVNSQSATPPTTATPLPTTRKPLQTTSGEQFALPVVDGLVREEILSSMGGDTAPATNSTATTITSTTPSLPVSFASQTSHGSTTVEASIVTETSALLFSKGPVVTTPPTVPTTTTFSEADYDLPFAASLRPELNLLDDDDGIRQTSSASTAGVSTTEQSTPSAEQATTDYDMTKERYCIAARFCYKELNERCVMRHMKSVCGCGRAFSRNPETLVCERKLPLLVSLELPEHSYVQELADKKSLEFKAYESGAQHLMWGLVRRSSVLHKTVLDVEVTGFRPGLQLRSKLLVMSSLVHKFTGDVSAGLRDQFEAAMVGYNSTGSFLRLRNMRTLSADVAVNPCEDHDSNYCSPHAICTYRKEDYGMGCRCLPGYQDVSPETGHHPGELCFSICEPGHCQNNGTCKSLGFGIECECQDWYTGNKCQFQMKRMIAIVVVVAAVLLTAVAVAVHKFWRRGHQQNCSNMVCRMLIMEPAKRGSSKRMPLDVKLDPCTSVGVHRAPSSTQLNSDASSLHSAFSKSLKDVSHIARAVVSK
ncbi:uncharacterized protein LOC144169376 [Haemaphysalis longicornis]